MTVIPSRGLLLVRPVETDETLPGAKLILLSETRERMTANQCEVIAVGAPAECDPTRSRAERKCEREHALEADYPRRILRVHPCPINVGDWLLVRARAYIDSPYPERKEWFLHQDDALAILSP